MIGTMRVDAVERAIREAFLSYAVLPDADVEQRGDLVSVRTRVPITFFNGVPYASLRPDRADSRVKETIARFREKSAPFRWWILPSSRPENLIEILKANGFRHTYDAPGMTIELDSIPRLQHVEGFEIRRVENAQMLREWAHVFGEGFHRPAEEEAHWYNAYSDLGLHGTWREFVGYLDGQPVATSSVCLSNDLAGIFHVVTLPPARGRGIGAAITIAALLEAKAYGCRIASLQSSEMAFSMYRAIGFQHCCDLTLYDWKPEYEG